MVVAVPELWLAAVELESLVAVVAALVWLAAVEVLVSLALGPFYPLSRLLC